MTNEEFQQWLRQFPDDAIIEVVVAGDAPMYASNEVEFDGEERQYLFRDFSGHHNLKPGDDLYGKKFLTLGEGD